MRTAMNLHGQMPNLESLIEALRKPCLECAADGIHLSIGVCEEHSNAEMCRCVLSTVARRQAARDEDLIYPVCGILRPKLLQVVYGCGIAAVRDAVLAQVPSVALVGAISSDWCGPSPLPLILGGRPTSGFFLNSPTAHASFDAGTGMRLTGRTERFRVWDTPGVPPVNSKEEWDAYPVILNRYGSGPESNMYPELLHAVSLDDHPCYISCSKAQVDMGKVKSVLAGFNVGQEDGLRS